MRSYSDKYNVNHLDILNKDRTKRGSRNLNAEGLAIIGAFFIILSAVTFGAVVFGISV